METRRAILPDDRAHLRDLLARIEEKDGYPPLSEEARVDFDSGDGDAGWLVESSDGCVGLGHRRVHRETVVVELAVGGERRRAVADTLVRGIRLDEIRRRVTIWVSDPHSEAAVLAAGGSVARRLVRLQRPLPAGTPEVADGVRITPFRMAVDEGAYLIVANDAFADHPESSAWTRETFDERAGRPWFDPGGLFLAWDRGRPIGACWTKIHSGEVGEIYSVAVRPSAGGSGMCTALVLRGFEYLATHRGAGTGMLWVDRANAAAVRMYRRLGMEPVRERVELVLRP